MERCARRPIDRQFTLAFLLSEITLIATALAALRLALGPPALWLEAQAVLWCVTLIAACGALGGVCLRMIVGLIAGGVFAVAALPLLWLVLSAA